MQLVVDTELEQLEEWFEENLRCAVDHDWLRQWSRPDAPACAIDAAAILSSHAYPFPVCAPLGKMIEATPEPERCRQHPDPTCFVLNWF